MAILNLHRLSAAPRRPARALFLLGTSALALGFNAAEAQSPQGGVVVGGAASIAQSAARSTITQTSQRAVIDWQGFDVGRRHRVVFDQPGRSSATLNRVNSARSSVIAGAIRAPGTVVIQNTAGVIFTGSAKVDVGGLVATSQAVDAGRFDSDGRLQIGGGEQSGARVANDGEITIGEAGLAALVGGNVENAGAIVAKQGTVALASGTRTTIDVTGDGMVRIAVEGGGGGVSNAGLIDVGGGRVLLTAGGAAQALDSVINTSGVIRASARTGDGGRIELVGHGKGKVSVSGTLEANGAGKGGTVTVTGASVALAGAARVGASGGDGGIVRLGGDRQGGGDLRRADRLTIAAGAEVAADGSRGAGGSVVAWSDGETLVDGRISATGATGGGFVETSGRFALGVGASAEVALGRGGEWLLDPRNVIIGTGGLSPVPPGTTTPPPGATAFQINRLAVVSALNDGSDVTISTVQPGSTMAGDITVSGALTWTGAGDLTLQAERDIRIDAPVTTENGSFAADAARHVIVNRNVQATGAGDVALTARTGEVRITEALSGNVVVSTASGRLNLTAVRGWVDLRRINAAGNNVQVFSNSGSVDITAGTGIDLLGGSQGGSWVRVGRTGDSSDVTLTAPLVKLFGGAAADAFSEVVAGAGGSITIAADDLRVLSASGGSEARIAALNGADLTLHAARQSWNGPVRAGTGGSDGGNVLLSGAITASVQPRFSLAPGRDFTLAPATPGGVPSSLVGTVPLAVSTAGGGSLDIGGTIEAPQITLVSQEQVRLRAGVRVTGTGPGDAVVIAAGRGFVNAAGDGAVAAPGDGARWLVYIDRFAGLDGTAPGPRGFDLYGRPFATNPPSSIGLGGNRVVYGESPVLTVTAETLSKSYGIEAIPGYVIAGLRPGDDLATAIDYVEVTSAGSPAGARVGRYATRASAVPSAQGYVLRSVDGTLTVDPATLTVTANDAARSYGAGNPSFSADIGGFVLGDDASILDGTLRLATSATRTSDAGRYAITASGLTVPDGNYRLSFVGGTLTVDPALLTVTVDDAGRTYGAGNPDFMARYAGFVLGQDAGDLGGTLAFASDATRRSPVGRYAVTAAGHTSVNYAISYLPGALTVDPAPLTVTANDAAKTYGAANPALSARYDGFVLGEGADDLGGALRFASDATRRSPVGSYAVTPRGLEGGNYALTYAGGTLAVDPAPLTVTANDAAKSYGAANPAFSARYDGFVLGEGAADLEGALDFATDATRTSAVGTYAVTPGGLASGNYVLTFAGGTLAVDPARLTVTADDAGRTYGGANPDFTARYAGFVLGEDPGDLGGALGFTTDAGRSSPAGRYTVAPGGLTSGNYAISYAGGTLTVDPASLTVTANDATRSYGAGDPRFSVRYDGFVLGESGGDLGGTLRFTSDATPGSPVGSYTVTPGGQTSGNYTIAYAGGTLTVDRAALTVAVNDATRTYGARNPAFTARYTGLVLGEGAGDLGGALDFGTSATRRSDVGSYAVTTGGLESGNYAISYVGGALKVEPASLTVIVDNASRTYGAANPEFTARLRGFVLGEDANNLGGALGFTTRATQRSAVGGYAVAARGLTGGNYAIAYAGGTLTVTLAPLTVTANDATRPTGQPNPGFSARFDGFMLGEDAGDLGGALDFATAAGGSSGPGRYAITPGGLSGGNYAIAFVDGTLTVTPGPVPPTLNPDANAAVADLVEPFGRGVPPLTPGDASFRTTVAEAPPAIDNPFGLTYSLGEIVQLAPEGAAGAQGFVAAAGGAGTTGAAADTQGFVPAAGGGAAAAPGTGDTQGFAPAAGGAGATEETPAGPCSGSVNRGVAADGCARQATAESYWTTSGGGGL